MIKILEVLEDINKSIKYQNKLLEDVFHQQDKKGHESQEMKILLDKQMGLIQEQIKNVPGMSNNPQAENLIKNIFDMIPKRQS